MSTPKAAPPDLMMALRLIHAITQDQRPYEEIAVAVERVAGGAIERWSAGEKRPPNEDSDEIQFARMLSAILTAGINDEQMILLGELMDVDVEEVREVFDRARATWETVKVKHDGSAEEKRVYEVFNETDGIPASPNLMTLAEAQAFVREFPERFKTQGYYSSAFGRIPVDQLKLTINQISDETEK
jgi:hypothetical protein